MRYFVTVNPSQASAEFLVLSCRYMHDYTDNNMIITLILNNAFSY